MAKAAAMLLILLASSLIGVRAAGRLQVRLKLLKQLDAFFRRLATGMAYRRAPLARLVQSDRECENSALLSGFRDALQQGAAPKDAWRSAMERAKRENATVFSLTAQDLELLDRFVATLGASDLRSQGEYAALFGVEMEKAIENAQRACADKARIYRSLGVLCGAAVAILLL